MIVVCEGLSCCGKTTLIEGCSVSGVVAVRKKLPRYIENPRVELFLQHDESKLHAAMEASSTGKMALVDRGYLSTLVFYSAMADITPNFSPWLVYRWLLQSLGASFFRPDHYIFIDIPVALSLERALKVRPLDDKANVWLQAPNRVLYWYERLFATIEHGVPVHSLDATQPVEVVQQQFDDLVQYLLNSPTDVVYEMARRTASKE